MTGAQLKQIREQLGLSVVDFGTALGYLGNTNSIWVRIREFERGKRLVPETVARLALMFKWYGVPERWRLTLTHENKGEVRLTPPGRPV